MATIKLKTPAGPRAPRPPVRGSGPRKRPTAAEANAEREARHAPPEREAAPRQEQRDPRPPREPRREERPAPPRAAPRNTAFGEPRERRPLAPARPVQERLDPPPRREDEPADSPTSLRLSKRMSELGIASRREADDWIAKGLVRVDGRVVSELGSRVTPDQRITIDAKAKFIQAQRVTVLINKPIGYVSGQAEDGYEPASVLVTPENQWKEDQSGIRFLREHLRGLAPAGRLDIDSTGLLVLTQDGRIAKQLIGESRETEKEYLVRVGRTVAGALPESDLALLRHGLELDGEPLLPAFVEWLNDDQLRFVLKEGKKRQVRRMCEAVGLKVLGLKRVRIGKVMLGDLPVGQWRYLGIYEGFE